MYFTGCKTQRLSYLVLCSSMDVGSKGTGFNPAMICHQETLLRCISLAVKLKDRHMKMLCSSMDFGSKGVGFNSCFDTFHLFHIPSNPSCCMTFKV